MSGAFLFKRPLHRKHIVEVINLEQNKNCFNVIYEDENFIMPEINDTDLLTFGMAFMQIRARELNNDKDYRVKDNKI